MATEAMLDMAVRKSTKPVGAHNADATLHRPRGYDDIEAEERAAAARSVVRMVLGRHGCAELSACPVHGRQACDCQPCLDPQHADDVALALEALRACGLAAFTRATHLTCSTCHKSKSRTRYSKSNTTCSDCLSAKKAAREAELGR